MRRGSRVISEILEAKRNEVARLRREPLTRPRTRPRFSFIEALKEKGLSIIAEIKRSSPSTGDLNVDINALYAAYTSAKVDALSILTDSHFGMAASDLEKLAGSCTLPILRKDFILSAEQIQEADVIGADAILLIATFLESAEMAELGAYAESLGLDVLYEAHSEEDLLKIPGRARIIGINNRNLSGEDYKTDISLSKKMIDELPADVVKVAESGFERDGEIPRGYDAALIGTGLIREFNRTGDVTQLVDAMKRGYC